MYSHNRGPPSLQTLVVATLIRFKSGLGDLGGTPLPLLAEVLSVCSATQLATIEDETLAGSGRSLRRELQRFWQQLCKVQFGPLPSGVHDCRWARQALVQSSPKNALGCKSPFWLGQCICTL